MRKIELAIYAAALASLVDKQYQIFNIPDEQADADLIAAERDKAAKALVMFLKQDQKPS